MARVSLTGSVLALCAVLALSSSEPAPAAAPAATAASGPSNDTIMPLPFDTCVTHTFSGGCSELGSISYAVNSTDPEMSAAVVPPLLLWFTLGGRLTVTLRHLEVQLHP